MNSFEKSQFSQSSSTLPQPPLETISRFYQPQKNSKTFRFIIVIAYVFCVSLAAIILSFYYMFFWDSTMPPVYKPKSNNCDKKIIIPEQIAIRLINSTTITPEQFLKNLREYHNVQLTQFENQNQVLYYKIRKSGRNKIAQPVPSAPSFENVDHINSKSKKWITQMDTSTTTATTVTTQDTTSNPTSELPITSRSLSVQATSTKSPSSTYIKKNKLWENILKTNQDDEDYLDGGSGVYLENH
ncbi:inafm2 family protein [Megaselia abdita]